MKKMMKTNVKANTVIVWTDEPASKVVKSLEPIMIDQTTINPEVSPEETPEVEVGQEEVESEDKEASRQADDAGNKVYTDYDEYEEAFMAMLNKVKAEHSSSFKEARIEFASGTEAVATVTLYTDPADIYTLNARLFKNEEGEWACDGWQATRLNDDPDADEDAGEMSCYYGTVEDAEQTLRSALAALDFAPAKQAGQRNDQESFENVLPLPVPMELDETQNIGAPYDMHEPVLDGAQKTRIKQFAKEKGLKDFDTTKGLDPKRDYIVKGDAVRVVGDPGNNIYGMIGLVEVIREDGYVGVNLRNDMYVERLPEDLELVESEALVNDEDGKMGEGAITGGPQLKGELSK